MENASTISNAVTKETLAPITLTIIGIYLWIACALGGFFNGTALYVFFTNKHLRSPTNVFIIGLLVCDFLMCTVGIPPPASSSMAHVWLWGWSGCIFHGLSVYVLGLSNMYILSAISVDRYIVIAKPLQASKINYRVVGLSLFLCYFFGILWSAFPLFGWSSYVYIEAGIACEVSYDPNDSSAFSYNVAIFIFCFILPIFIMVYSYYYVFMTIRTMSRNTAFDKKSRIAKRNLRIEKKMAKTIAAMIGVFLFAWTPYAIASFWVAFGFGDLPLIVATVPSIFAKTGSVWNPLVYVFTNKQFRTALYQKVPCEGLRNHLVKREEEKEKESEESDVEDDKGKQSLKTKVQNLQVQERRPGVHPADDDDDDAGEITIVEDARNYIDELKHDETEFNC